MKPLRWLALAVAPVAFSQTFEVASVKRAPGPIEAKDDYTAGYTAGRRAAMAAAGIRISGRRVEISDNSLRDLIRLAFRVLDFQISGPAWMAEEKYVITATLPDGADAGQAPEMLQALLRERFHLEFHREAQQMNINALVPVSGGAKLTPATGRRCFGMANPAAGRATATPCTLAAFAEQLSKAVGSTVVDATGIAGTYDFNVAFSPDEGPATVLREQYGLRLEKRRMPVDVMVVDRADRNPIEN